MNAYNLSRLIKMSVYPKIIYFLILSLFPATFIVGMPNLGIAGQNLGVAEEMVAPIFSQEYSFPKQAQNVWQTASDIVASRIKHNNGRVLVKDSSNLIISWIERLGTAVEDREKVEYDPKSGKTMPPYKCEVLEVGEGGIAFTTISVRNRSNGSLLRIRRVYYGQLTQPNMVHSRGVFANHFQELVNRELGIDAAKKAF